ncbi:transporter substrate-binding domain-containing protein [Geomonas propionica]|uniref:histidine kinase n=1 Tax=Geomonas propionica TaxID=2798582 RepID=A0ABS0YQR5_9BACT|nr:transporter substrate-binding domain-containing protein [Geomonas propionica]MBJ6799850.1 transporter substrate-binding domain-containing protein [Geomonas propionica]
MPDRPLRTSLVRIAIGRLLLAPQPGRGCLLLALVVLCFLAAPSLVVAAGSAAAAQVRTVVVGGDRDYPPYEFIDRSGQPAGYNVDLTRAIAEVMGMKVEFRLGNWAEMRDALQAGRVDVLQGMSYSAERSDEVDFSVPHAVVNHAIFGRKDNPSVNSLEELKGKTVAVHRGGIMHDYLIRQGVGGKLTLTDTPADALRLVASGKVEYAVVAIVPGMYMIRELKLTNLVPVVRNVATQRYCYAVDKGNAELLSRFNEGLAILKKTGQYDAIHNKWLGVVDTTPIDLWTIIKYAAVVVVPLFLLLSGFALWSRTLHRQVALRTADLTREIAERRQVEEELRLNQQQLVQADKMAALGVLVSGVAHEINNPTGIILLEAPILKRFHTDATKILERYYEENGDFICGGLPYSRMRQEVPKSLEKIQDAGKRIKRIVDDLKDFARQDSTSGNEVIDLNTAAQAAVRLVEPTIRKATRNFSVGYRKGLPRVRGNRQRIEQVLVNLILNACQALPDPERGIELITWHDAFRDTVVLRLRDEGAGIAPEHLSRLTDPFFTTKQDQGGTGLGLSVSAGIVKEHGGTLEFQSDEGGTTVTLTLPAHHKEATA